MKTAFLTLCLVLACCFGATAQQDINSITNVGYYGIDFSKVRIFRAKETPDQFKRAFEAINELTQNEPKKYNFGKCFKKTVETKSFDVVDKRNAESIPNMLPKKTSSKQLEAGNLTREDLKAVITDYGNGDTGVGVVIVADLLNKDAGKGYYDVVFFDVNSKEILFEKQVVGNVGGAGLRNFWANSVLDAVKGFKYKQ